jgi:hypothetical protein
VDLLGYVAVEHVEAPLSACSTGRPNLRPTAHGPIGQRLVPSTLTM